jgi:hypothetical protein
MSRNISNTARIAINAPQTDQVFLVILTIDHPDLSSPMRVVNNKQSVISNGETYIATAFSFIPPAQEDGVISNSQLSIDNVDRLMVQVIRTISSPADISASIILADSPDVVEAGPWDFKLRDVTYNRETVSGELVYASYLRDNLGTIKYKNINFPGLFG